MRRPPLVSEMKFSGLARKTLKLDSRVAAIIRNPQCLETAIQSCWMEITEDSLLCDARTPCEGAPGFVPCRIELRKTRCWRNSICHRLPLFVGPPHHELSHTPSFDMSPNVGLGTQGPVERGWGLWLTSVLGVIIAGLSVGARLAQRYVKRCGLGVDDWMIIAALVASILLTMTECQGDYDRAIMGTTADFKQLWCMVTEGIGTRCLPILASLLASGSMEQTVSNVLHTSSRTTQKC
jgi:hypothetical protein